MTFFLFPFLICFVRSIQLYCDTVSGIGYRGELSRLHDLVVCRREPGSESDSKIVIYVVENCVLSVTTFSYGAFLVSFRDTDELVSTVAPAVVTVAPSRPHCLSFSTTDHKSTTQCTAIPLHAQQ